MLSLRKFNDRTLLIGHAGHTFSQTTVVKGTLPA